LIGWWTLDGKDISGVHAYDASGNGNRGTLTNNPDRVPGNLGQGLEFDGVDDNVNLGTGNNLGNLSPLTYSAWIKPDSHGESNQGHIISKEFSTKRLYLDPTGQIFFEILFDGGSHVNINSVSNSVTMGKWQHVVVTWDGSNPASGVKVYVDNAQVASSFTNDGIGSPQSESSDDYLIGNRGAGDRTFNGLIDDVRIYNRALSADEIKRLYKIGATAKISTTQTTDSLKTGLVGHWTFDGKHMSGTHAYDASGNGNRGTLTGGPVRGIGKIGQGLSFDGSNDTIEAGNGSSLKFERTDQFSGAAWIKLESYFSPDEHRMIFGKVDNTGGTIRGYFFAVLDGGELRFFVLNTLRTGNYLEADGAGTINLHQWYHVAFTYSGNSNVSGVKLYVNGAPVTVSSITNALTATIDHNDPFEIGSRDGNTQQWDGLIDDVRVYNRALSADEIKRLYNMGR
jgi:hypothetical protein